jgi:hypothetical protein
MKLLSSFLLSLAALIAAGAAAHAQSSLVAKVGYAGLIDCDQPKQVKDFKFSGDGTMKLSQDRSASLDMDMKGLTTSELKIDTKLGNRPAPAPGGTALLRVVNANQLQAIWSLPNNDIIVTMRASQTACTMNVTFRLKHGARQYSIYDQNGFYFCGRPRMTSLTCAIKQ